MFKNLRLSYLLVIGVLLTVLNACAGDPVVVAEDVELKAQALFAEYVIAEEAAAKLIQSPEVPDDVKLAIQKAHKELTPLVEALEEQRVLVANLKVSDPEDVPTALNALNELLLKLQPLVNNFSTKVGK